MQLQGYALTPCGYAPSARACRQPLQTGARSAPAACRQGAAGGLQRGGPARCLEGFLPSAFLIALLTSQAQNKSPLSLPGMRGERPAGGR